MQHCSSRKQRHTAKRIYDRLVVEHGFSGGETTVRRLVKELREKAPEAFVPLVFPPGDALQIDWGDATVYLHGVKTTVNLFALDYVTVDHLWCWRTVGRMKKAS